MKRPVTEYGFWTGYRPKAGEWFTYFMRRDDEDGEPIGEEGTGSNPQASLMRAAMLAADYDDGDEG